MQIVIDIDERYFEIIKASVESGNDYKPFVLFANGKPLPEVLDSIKGEIGAEIDWYFGQKQEDAAQILGTAIAIIDKYRKEQSNADSD